MNKKYDAVLVERQCSIEVKALAMLPDFIDGDVILLDIEATEVESCAMGAIKEEVAEKLDYDLTGLKNYVVGILNDMANETPTHEYIYHENGTDVHILLTRSLTKAKNAKYKRTIFVPEEDAMTIQKYLSGQEFQHEDNTISFTACFDDGREMDIKCCGASRNGENQPSWTEAVLFDHGSEVSCTEPCDTFFGTWELKCNGNIYSVEVVKVDSQKSTYCNMVQEAEKYGWTLTDDDDFQWQREVIEQEAPLVQTYEMCQLVSIGDKYGVCHGNVRIGAVPYEELDELVRFYGYDGLDDFVKQTSPSDEFVTREDGSLDREKSPAWILEYPLLAEMDFETRTFDEYFTGRILDNRKEAEAFVWNNYLKKAEKEGA